MINIILVLLTFLMPFQAEDFCTCLPQGSLSKKEFNTYDLIFEGRVMGFRDQAKMRFYEVSVDRTYKGSTNNIVDISTYQELARCGVDFKIGEKWLIFAYQIKGRFKTDLCTRTQKMKVKGNREKLKKDLEFLRKTLENN